MPDMLRIAASSYCSTVATVERWTHSKILAPTVPVRHQRVGVCKPGPRDRRRPAAVVVFPTTLRRPDSHRVMKTKECDSRPGEEVDTGDGRGKAKLPWHVRLSNAALEPV